MIVPIPFGRTALDLRLDEPRLRGLLVPRSCGSGSGRSERDIVRDAILSPIGTPRLRDMARGIGRATVITADHTRPMPSRITLPLILEEIRRGAPEAEIFVLVATGCHRPMTGSEMRERFGDEVCARERILMHDCTDASALTSIGALPSGGDCVVNRAATDCDLLVSEGFIEPHFFAGFSGGRKAVLPGSAGRASVLANHCAEFIASDRARAGILDGNPIHADMIHAARAAGLAFIVNVVLDGEKKVEAAFAGDVDAAHRAGCGFLAERARVKAVPADIVVTSNGGHPLDQNVYQAVKSMTAAEAACNRGGVIICASECADGHGGAAFADAFRDFADAEGAMNEIRGRGRGETRPDQWQIQIFCRVLMHASVIMVTGPGAPREMIEKLNMKWAATLDGAMRMAEAILGDPAAGVTVIPDGVGVIVETAERKAPAAP